MTTEMSTSELASKIESNRDTHQRKYEEAIEAFWVKASAFAEKTAARVKERDPAFLKVTSSRGGAFGGLQMQAVLSVLGMGAEGTTMPTPPPCYTKDYDQALEMVKAHQGETIELGSSDFAKLVLDKWEWSGDFNSSYAALTG
jgi:hypothetical protein